jgi:hypothetical protein
MILIIFSPFWCKPWSADKFYFNVGMAHIAIVRKVQESIDEVEQWALMWGFMFSAEKTETVFFTRRKVGDEVRLRLYRRHLERVGTFRFPGVYFDTRARLTWAEHIERVVGKCKKVLNVTRCLTGKEWRAGRPH